MTDGLYMNGERFTKDFSSGEYSIKAEDKKIPSYAIDVSTKGVTVSYINSGTDAQGSHDMNLKYYSADALVIALTMTVNSIKYYGIGLSSYGSDPTVDFSNLVFVKASDVTLVKTGGVQPSLIFPYVSSFLPLCHLIRKVAKMAIKKLYMNGIEFVRQALNSTVTVTAQTVVNKEIYASSEIGDSGRIGQLPVDCTAEITGVHVFQDGSITYQIIDPTGITNKINYEYDGWVTSSQINWGVKRSLTYCCNAFQHLSLLFLMEREVLFYAK